MEASSAAKVTKSRQQELGDRISSLPDAILCHILSFLPTKYSVRTRLLSTRWKFLFSHVPLLDFDLVNCYKNDISRRKFINFVNMVLMMYDFPQLTKFRLHSSATQLDELVTWILYAVRHNVRELDLFVLLNKPKTIPRELFSSETLSVLKLSGDLSLKLLPSSALLPCLKTLELKYFTFDLSAQRILSICPALDDLFLYNCYLGEEEVLAITNTSLRKLRIGDCDGRELILNVPSLVLFEYLNSDFSENCGENALTSLVEAIMIPDMNMDSATFVQLLNVVSHARRLYLSMYSFEVFEDCVKAVPTFHKLTRLEVDVVTPTVYELLPDFLNKCSTLEVLVFANGFCHKAFDEVDVTDIMHVNDTECYKNVPLCVLRHLKEIEFRSFTMRETEWELVEYFLKNAQVLQEMKIQSKLSLEKQSDLSQKLLTFSRFSKDCQIVIENDDEIEDSDDETKDSDDEIVDSDDDTEDSDDEIEDSEDETE